MFTLNYNTTTYIIAILSIFCSSTSQILLKKATTPIFQSISEVSTKGYLRVGFDVVSNFYLLSGLILQVFALILWLRVLKNLPVSSAYPLIALGFVYVFVFDVVTKNSEFSLTKLAGTFLIIIGIFILGRS